LAQLLIKVKVVSVFVASVSSHLTAQNIYSSVEKNFVSPISQ
jgi:hypothetical protein